MSSSKNYKLLADHYEKCFEKYGDSHLGVDWPIERDAQERYRVMLEIADFSERNESNTVLDFGCGLAHLYDYIKAKNLSKRFKYCGLDLSQKFIDECVKKHPTLNFYCLDICDPNFSINPYDYIIMNGLYTEKRELSFEEMWEFFTKSLKTAFQYAEKGIAFNLMSKQVDWERDDLFHMPLDMLQDYLTKELSRNFIIRNDYKLFEFTVYLYK